MAFSDEEDEPGETGEREDRARIWADLDLRRERAERTGMREELGVRRGETWWRWDPHSGEISNEEDSETTITVAEEIDWMLGGLALVGALRLGDVTRSTVASRETWRLRATPRGDGENGHDWSLHRLPGYGAEAYELDVDAETGLILRVAGIGITQLRADAESDYDGWDHANPAPWERATHATTSGATRGRTGSPPACASSARHASADRLHEPERDGAARARALDGPAPCRHP